MSPSPEEIEEPHKNLYIFGRDVSQIPCFRKSFLYGIGGGLVVGVLTFLATSRTKFSTNVGFSTFFCSTMGYWFTCRYEWSKKKFECNQLQQAMKKAAMYEGTHLEEELRKKGQVADA